MDITWNFQTNDVSILNGDFFLCSDASVQNATLIVLKEAVNVIDPTFGVDFESRYANSEIGIGTALCTEAKQQVLQDGASMCNIVLTSLDNGEFNLEVQAKYPTT